MITILKAFSTPFSPPTSNYAYLDPGSGSIILQVILAALLGGLFLVKAYWNKIIAFFRKTKPENKDHTEE